MARDVMAGRPTEVGFMFGGLVLRAAKVSVGVPRVTLAHELISAMDPDR
ncbi:hypothetical protein Pmi06nite_17060 [Planotetraspora mira]|uniref:Ketopantoate reductase C-terminal domain-containing protein n=2 Tax=Planotetraspora mira TaxID=58121 RepID=A0A8J3X5Z9_9ACTN|nr:hypothetical protein Pmi06nite_17060 [Planotetraspora mira]